MATRRRGNGEGTIYQRGDGRWVGMLTYYAGGRRKRKALYGRTRQEVAARLARALREQQDGLPVPDERLTVRRFLGRWLEESVRPSVRPRTYESYHQLVRLHLAPGLGHLRLAKLAPQDVQRFLNEKFAAGLSPRTVQYLRAVLRRALGQAMRWGLVARNVATLVEPPRGRPREIEPFTAEQARAFLDAVRGDRLEALYAVALALGLRQGEALGLCWQDVDLERAVLHVRHALQRVDGRLQLGEPKTDKSRRTLPLPAFAVEALRAHKVRQLEERLAAGPRWQETGFVFTSTIGTPLEPRNVVRQYHAHLRRAGLPRKRFHDLRHSAASLLRAQGVPLADIKDLLGHSQISLTADLYAHLMADAQRQAASRMDALLGRPGAP